MDRDEATQLAVAAALMAIAKGINPGKVMADLYEAGVEDGKAGVMDDPQAYGLVGLPC